MSRPNPFEGVPAPEVIKAALRRYTRGQGVEKERGRSEMRGLINFYRTMPERKVLLEFLEEVWKRYN